MKKLILFFLMIIPSFAMAAGPSIPLDKANNDLADKASLQRGAKLYMNYCIACHSMKYQRYNRVARDLGIPEDLMLEHLVLDKDAKIGDLIESVMPEQDATNWFGIAPPDLTLIARVRGNDWLYTYLRSFYADESRPFGVNNKVFPNVGMPHVLEELQGIGIPEFETHVVNGVEEQVLTNINFTESGEMSQQEYDNAMRDLVNFLDYSGEPVKLERKALGWWVLGFILIFGVLAYLLKKEYWRDVH